MTVTASESIVSESITERVARFVLNALFVFLPLYVIVSIYIILPPLQGIAVFVLVMIVMVYLRDFLGAKRRSLGRVINLFLAGLSVGVFGFPVLYHEIIIENVGRATPLMVQLGLLSIALTLDATRRTLGWPLTIIIALAVVYLFYGQLIPRDFGGHGGYRTPRIVTTVYLGTNGIYGVVSSTLFNFVILFVLFGKVLEAVGALRFIERFAAAVVGRYTGGPALVAVVASGMMGSVTGSAVANVMITGSVSIPIMKRLGFKANSAAAVETAASTGGQFMPPVMGAAAFIMAQFVGVSYLTIIAAALIPATLYFLGVLVGTYYLAVNEGLKPLPVEERPSVKQALRDPAAVIFGAGIGSLVFFLVAGTNAMRAAVYAIVAMLVLYFLLSSDRDYRKILATIPGTSRDFLSIGIAGPSVGIIVATLLLTGVGSRAATIIFNLVGETLLPVLLISMLIAIILGVGLPTSVAYILSALILAPVIISLGVPVLSAHMFLFYMAMMSMVTPPVALAAYAAAAIAGTDFWSTGVKALLLALPAFLLPYAFVYDSALLLDGSGALRVFVASFSAAIGVTALAMGLFARRNPIERVLLLGAAGMLIAPQPSGDFVGLVFLALGSLGAAARSRRMVKVKTEERSGPQSPVPLT